MRKIAFLVLALLIYVSFSFPQEIIENPAKLLSQNAGRVIQLKEVMRITDKEGKFYFKGPWDVKIARDGSIFIHEPDKLLQFDPKGQFIKNHYKKGEGPGELNQNLTDFLPLEDGIILYSSNMNKIIRTDMQGNIVEEFRPEPGVFSSLAGYYIRKYYFFDNEPGDYVRQTGIFEDYLRLYFTDGTNEAVPTSNIFAITVQRYVDSRMSSGGAICRLQKVNKGPRYVYLFHTPEYLVKLLDLEKNRAIQSFRREYKRVKFVFNRKLPYPMPLPKFCNDIQRLLIHKDTLWVVTSTYLKDKGILVDVFSDEGKYQDNFYLPLFKILTKERASYYAPMDIYEDYLFIVEIGEDDLISVAKYEIFDKENKD